MCLEIDRLSNGSYFSRVPSIPQARNAKNPLKTVVFCDFPHVSLPIPFTEEHANEMRAKGPGLGYLNRASSEAVSSSAGPCTSALNNSLNVASV